MRALILTAVLAAPVQAQTPQCMGLPDDLAGGASMPKPRACRASRPPALMIVTASG